MSGCRSGFVDIKVQFGSAASADSFVAPSRLEFEFEFSVFASLSVSPNCDQ